MSKKKQYVDPFDALETGINFDPQEAKKYTARQEKEFNKRDYLIHKVFAQNKDGQELLKMWVRNVIIEKPVIQLGGGQSHEDMGISQGMQNFVRGILLTCERIERT